MIRSTSLLPLGPQFSPLSLIRALWKRKLFITGVTIGGVGSAVCVVMRLPPLYTANAVILVESQKIPENFVPATVQTALDAQLDTLKQQVLSRDRLWGLVEAYDLYPKERQRLAKEEVFQLMRRDINISLSRGWSARGPGAFQVEYQARRPETAAAVANQIGMFFINENLRQRTDEALETSKFLDEQLEAAESRLREQESKLKEFKVTHNGELPEQEAALLAAVSQGRTELLGIQEGVARAQQNKLILESSLAHAQTNLRQRQELLRAQTAARASTLREPAPAAAVAVPTPLDLAENELAKLRARYQDSHDEEPENNRIQELGEQIAMVKQEIRNLGDRGERVMQDVADAQTRIRSLPVREQQLAVITRDYDTSKTNYQSLLNKKLAADVATDMERWHKSQKFVMLDRARLPQKPTSPRRTLLIAASSVFSLGLGIGLALLLELQKNVFLGEWELPAGMVVIGRIPRMRLPSL